MTPTKQHRPDYILLGVTLFLLLIGLVILASVSVFFAAKNLDNPYYYLSHQLVFGVLVGLIAGAVIYKLPLERFKKWSLLLLIGNIVLLVLVFIPGIGWESGGASRWIRVGSFTFQPSEFLKLTFLFYLASWLATKKEEGSMTMSLRGGQRLMDHAKDLLRAFVPFVLILSVISVLLLLQPDMSTLGVIALSALAMYFAAGTPVWHTLLFGALGGAAAITILQWAQYRVSRLLIFLNPELDPLGKGYQIKQALIAIGSGGLFGKGLGLSQQKLGFLPQPIGDSIFAIFAEEAGFLGSIVLLMLFVLLMWRGFLIASRVKSPLLSLFAIGITIHIALQAFVNMAALIGLLPLTGIPLPFISYGGTALIVSIAEVAVLLNISRYT